MLDNKNAIVTVSQLNLYIKSLFDTDPMLAGLYVKGEISNFTNHKSGHLYMTLKDETSLIRAVMFKSSAAKLKFAPSNGMKVIVKCRVSVFERDGQYQLYIDDMQPDGIGALYLAFEQLKQKLNAEGLFDVKRKRPLPRIPLRVGIVTSPTGAAIRDMINIFKRRFPIVTLVLYPVLVQGSDAPPQIVRAVNYFSNQGNVDLIIVGRGGGSIEELWAFNDERVARAVVASKVPVISAVGHETDFTICDFAADLRAPTPSAAAELAVPSTLELSQKFTNVIGHVKLIMTKRLEIDRNKLKAITSKRILENPMYILDDKRLVLEYLIHQIGSASSIYISKKRENFTKSVAKLEALNPLAVLSRGYSIIQNSEGTLVKSISDVTKGEKVKARVSDGNINCTVD